MKLNIAEHGVRIVIIGTIYNGVCSMDIQVRKAFDTEKQAEKWLLKHGFHKENNYWSNVQNAQKKTENIVQNVH